VTEIEKLARELIALPSVNPAFLPNNHADTGEGRVADFLAATAAKAGLDVHLQMVLPGRSNVLARLAPAGRIKQRILLAPHMDTVTVISRDQFVPRLRHGRIYGRGACDTKRFHCLDAQRSDSFGSKPRPATCDGNCFRRVD